MSFSGEFSQAPPTRDGRRTLRRGNLSVQVNVRVLGMIVLVFIMLAALAIYAMMLGSLQIPANGVIKSVFGNGTEQQEFVVRTLRLPRVIVAMLVGAALAASGAIFQGLVRNPLVSPDIIGIDSGSNLFVTIWIVSGFAWSLIPVVAFAGAALTASIIYALSWRQGVSPSRMILVGIGIGSAVTALTTLIMVRGSIEAVRPAQVWSIGSVYGSDWTDVRTIGLVLMVLLPLSIGLMWPMRLLQLGEDSARALGLPVERLRLFTLLVASALAAAAVAIAGPIGFVALMVPHTARMLAGPLSGTVLVLTALLGAFFLLLADVIGQHFLPVQLPVGVLTSAIGAPYFLYLLFHSNRQVM